MVLSTVNFHQNFKGMSKRLIDGAGKSPCLEKYYNHACASLTENLNDGTGFDEAYASKTKFNMSNSNMTLIFSTKSLR